jgi:hypothetical protein
MRRWKKTTMLWDFELEQINTDIPITDWRDPTIPEQVSSPDRFHQLGKIEAVALPEQEGEMLLIIRCFFLTPSTTEHETIATRLKEGIARSKEKITFPGHDFYWIRVEATPGSYHVKFKLMNGAHFCESTLQLVREIFSILSIKDETGFQLSRFTLSQETFIQLEGRDDSWVSYANWLRILNRLPVRSC